MARPCPLEDARPSSADWYCAANERRGANPPNEGGARESSPRSTPRSAPPDDVAARQRTCMAVARRGSTAGGANAPESLSHAPAPRHPPPPPSHVVAHTASERSSEPASAARRVFGVPAATTAPPCIIHVSFRSWSLRPCPPAPPPRPPSPGPPPLSPTAAVPPPCFFLSRGGRLRVGVTRRDRRSWGSWGGALSSPDSSGASWSRDPHLRGRAFNSSLAGSPPPPPDAAAPR
ncbi:hypothetical protein T484DRAFT_1925337 [Baffinella frigidus]|nr:hypothetical protein T484DRAFT_1925337 [Cryptophyta sp. CCMP2293]